MSDMSRPRWVYGAIILAALGLLFGGIAIGSRVNRNAANLDDLCGATNDSREVLRNVLLLSESQGQRHTFPAEIKTDGQAQTVVITFPDLGANDKFYRQALVLVKPVKC